MHPADCHQPDFLIMYNPNSATKLKWMVAVTIGIINVSALCMDSCTTRDQRYLDSGQRKVGLRTRSAAKGELDRLGNFAP
jgi:hypothetical protein